MRVSLELEFPDEQAASVMRQLQGLPEMTIRFLSTGALEHWQQSAGPRPADKNRLTEQEQNALLDQVFGSWQSDETGEELVRQIYEARQDQPRDIDL